jgi:gamma-glutamylcyclotransferase (GGCT)/AIG2-like uncharacterized protein YtfP
MSPTPEAPLVFAYGSNLDFDQMKSRCPSARMVYQATLPHHRLGFTRESKKRGCGVAGLIKAVGRVVWGVVYQLSTADLRALDAHEGFDPSREKNSYTRRVATLQRDGEVHDLVDVFVYFDAPQPNPPPPNAAYKKLIIDGACAWKLPQPYLAELEAIVTKG